MTVYFLQSYHLAYFANYFSFLMGARQQKNIFENSKFDIAKYVKFAIMKGEHV